MQARNSVSVGRGESKPVAWVTLVLGLDLSYVAAAAVLAAALKRQGTKGVCVCMVTEDVPETAQGLLKRVFDRVVPVPYQETLALQKYSERFDAMYNYWLDRCFTKFAMFMLVDYEKVIFLDADMLPLENPDCLFDCPAPAGICSSVKDASENERLHGMPLPRLLIDESLKNGPGHYGVRGCLLIMKPDLEVFCQIKNKIGEVASYGSLDSMVGPDEYLITKHFRDQWNHVHAKYGWVAWAERKDLGVDPVFLHYVSQKPWDEGEAWEDFEYWKSEAKELLKEIPEAIIYFSHITESMAEMSGIALTDEMKTVAKCARDLTPNAVTRLCETRQLVEEAKETKAKEKALREARAKDLGIDLTMGYGGKNGSWAKGKADGCTRNTPRTGAGPPPTPNSARGSGERNGGGGQVVTKKVSANVLEVCGFKRHNGNARQKEVRPQRPLKNKNSNPSNANKKDAAVEKPTVPKLNLKGVHGEQGPKSSSGWNRGHWKTKQVDSKADVEDWRVPSARMATPERSSEDTRPVSARNWPLTPGSAHRNANYVPHPSKRAQTPKSSRADLAVNWRSTPRAQSSEIPRRLSPSYGDGGAAHSGAFQGFHGRHACEANVQRP